MEQKIGMFLLSIVVVMGALFFAPWKMVTWGKLKVTPGDTVTVVGEAKTQQKNQKASFTAGVSAVSDNKETAVADVNKKIDAIIAAVKAFGISADDIRTQNINVFQGEESYYEEGRQKSRLGQWRVSNSVEITLLAVERANELADILTQSGATNVYGPNFMLDDTNDAESGLIEEAMKNARDKAVLVAQASGRQLGGMVSFVEGYQPLQSFYRMEAGGGGGGASLEPGSGTVTKTVTVTFELKP